MPVEVMRAFEEKFEVKILEGYDLSETSPVATFNRLDRERKPGSIGLPVWGVSVRIVDQNDQDAGTALDKTAGSTLLPAYGQIVVR